jgi:hydrogenase nickel incorporation protein HypA/HybF
MHEYSIIQSLVDSVESAMTTKGRVRSLEVRIGELSGVDCELLATAYEVFREGTICEHADMRIERIAASWQCPKCSQPIARGTMLRCRTCDEPAHLAAGDEIVLQRIELEVA